MASKRKRCVITKEELISFGVDVEKKVVQRMRDHGIPVKGMFHFKGIREGVMSARNLPDGSRVVEWWPSINDAKDDGVIFGEDNEKRWCEAGGTIK